MDSWRISFHSSCAAGRSSSFFNSVHPQTEPAEPPQSDLPKKIKCKRQRNLSNWKSNVRKAAHGRGKEYISVRKNEVSANKIKTVKVVSANRIKTVKDYQTKCTYNCQQLIIEDDRKHIFEHYYTLNEHGKRLYLLATGIVELGTLFTVQWYKNQIWRP